MHLFLAKILSYINLILPYKHNAVAPLPEHLFITEILVIWSVITIGLPDVTDLNSDLITLFEIYFWVLITNALKEDYMLHTSF